MWSVARRVLEDGALSVPLSLPARPLPSQAARSVGAHLRATCFICGFDFQRVYGFQGEDSVLFLYFHVVSSLTYTPRRVQIITLTVGL